MWNITIYEYSFFRRYSWQRGCRAIKEKLPKIIKEKNIDFVIANGENAADDGNGITEKIAEELLNSGIDVLTSGNHIWDKEEINSYIKKQKDYLADKFLNDSPGNGFSIFETKKFENRCFEFNGKCIYGKV